MNGLTALLVGSGSAVGAVARYSVGKLVARVNSSDFPWGTFIINMLGTLLLGLVFQTLSVHHHHPDWWMLLGTGFCGGFTTFSTMSLETVHLFRQRKLLGVIYLVTSLALGLVLAWLAPLWL
jgi:fluoride exporter